MSQAAAVVAHFDDAVIWAGGAIRRTRRLGWDWTIVCTCAAEPMRRAYFLASCEALGARGVALEFADHPDGKPFSCNDHRALVEGIRVAAGQEPLDWVFTHNADRHGEYGLHPNHAEAARGVLELVRSGGLTSRGVVEFSYRRLGGAAGPPVARPSASHILALDYDELAFKADWCARARDVELVDPTLGGVSWLEGLGWPCPNPEAFSIRGAGLPPPFVRR